MSHVITVVTYNRRERKTVATRLMNAKAHGTIAGHREMAFSAKHHVFDIWFVQELIAIGPGAKPATDDQLSEMLGIDAEAQADDPWVEYDQWESRHDG